MAENASGQITINGMAAGYNGVITLSQVQQISVAGNIYNLFQTPLGGGSLVLNQANFSSGDGIVVDGAGTNSISFTGSGSAYWYAGAGTTAAALASGTTTLYFAGSASDYTVAYDGKDVVTVTNTGSKDGVGTKTLTLTGGSGELVFGNGTRIGLGTSYLSDTVQYGTSGNDTFTANAGGGTFDGGAGVNTVILSLSGIGLPDEGLQFGENASGQFVITASADGYNGTLTLTHIQQLELGSSYYDLFATPVGGGSLVLNAANTGSNNTLLTDLAGTDMLTLGDTNTNYWHAGAGTTTATVTTGTTEIYFTGPASDYTETYDGIDKLVVINANDKDGTGTKTLILQGGSGNLLFSDGTNIGFGTLGYGAITALPVQYGTNGNDTFDMPDGTSSVDGGAGTNIAVLGSSSDGQVLNGSWQVTRNATGQIVISANNAEFQGTATLNHIQEVGIDGGDYDLYVTPLNGGVVTLSAAVVGSSNTLVSDTAGKDTINFDSSGENYWIAGAGITTANLVSGTTEIYLAGAASDYTEKYDGIDKLTVTNTGNEDSTGTKTLVLTGGTGTVIFGDGTQIGLGGNDSISGEPSVQYGDNGYDFFPLSGGNSTIYGGGGSDAVYFQTGTGAFDGRWSVVDNAAGQVVIGGKNAGYAGTATLSGVEQVTDGGYDYALFATPAKGGSVTVTGNDTLVADGAGTDMLLFTGTGSNEWHAGAGTTTATLSAGQTEIYLAGPAADYTESYDGLGTLTVTNTGNKDGTGTKTIQIAGGTGELMFGDHTAIGVGGGASNDTVQYGGSTTGETLNGTDLSDTIYTGVASTVNGNGGNDTYWFGKGDGSVQINNGNGMGPATGQVDLLGSVTDQNLWFLKSGNNLVADIIGTKDQVTINNYYGGGAAAQVGQFDAGNLELDTQLATLVQAMATYSSNNSAFNPQTATAMPTDTTLQNAIAAAWHSWS